MPFCEPPAAVYNHAPNSGHRVTEGGFSEYVLIPNAELNKQVCAVPEAISSKAAVDFIIVCDLFGCCRVGLHDWNGSERGQCPNDWGTSLLIIWSVLQYSSESHTGKTDVTAPVSCVFSM